MTVMTGTTFGLVQGDLIKASIAATNPRGEGKYSDLNTQGAEAKVAPHTPTVAPTRGSLTNDNQLEVQWEFVTDIYKAGGASILSYSLFIDDGNGGEFYEVDGDSKSLYTLNSIVIQSGIASGATYRLKYKVKNIYGFS